MEFGLPSALETVQALCWCLDMARPDTGSVAVLGACSWLSAAPGTSWEKLVFGSSANPVTPVPLTSQRLLAAKRFAKPEPF